MARGNAALGLGALAAAVMMAGGFVAAEAPHGSGHDHGHHTSEAAKAVVSNTPGFPNIRGGDFRLLDGQGRVRTAKNPAGRPN
jgi:hypothetical protein